MPWHAFLTSRNPNFYLVHHLWWLTETFIVKLNVLILLFASILVALLIFADDWSGRILKWLFPAAS